MHQDPICGKMVEEDRAIKLFYDGRTIYFCSSECARQFGEDPEGFLEDE